MDGYQALTLCSEALEEVNLFLFLNLIKIIGSYPFLLSRGKKVWSLDGADGLGLLCGAYGTTSVLARRSRCQELTPECSILCNKISSVTAV